MVNGPYPLSLAKAEDYFYRESQGEFVAQEHELLPHTFGGNMLAEFGLKPGPFSQDDYKKFLRGPMAAEFDEGLKDIARVVQDIPWSIPKGFSIASLVDGAGALLIPAIIHANNEHMRYMCKYARARVTIDGVSVKVAVTGMMWATFWHISSRERDENEKWGVAGGADPQIHAHNLVSKWVRVDGKLFELDEEDGYVARKAVEAFSQADIERELYRARDKAMRVRA